MLARRIRLVVLVLGLVTVAAAVGAITLTGGDRIKRFDGVQTATPACTSAAPDFEPMPEMSLPFDVPPGGQVVLLFQGQFGGFTSTPGARAIIRLTIDGEIAASAVAVGNDHGTGLQTFGFNAFAPVGPGSHTAEALWHTFPPGATSCVEERSIIVSRP